MVRLCGGLTIWAVGFSTLYLLHGYGCSSGWQQREFGSLTLLGLILILTWIGLILSGGLFAIIMQLHPAGSDGMITQLARIGAWSGLAGIIFMGAPVVLPGNCL